MRNVLLKRVRQLTERFAADLTGVVVSRVEADLAHIGEILEYSLSAIASDLGHPAFASEDSHDDSDRRDHDPVPRVRRSTRRGLRDDEARGQGRPDPGARDGEHAQSPQAPNQGREEGQRPARLVVDRDVKPANVVPPGWLPKVVRVDARPDKTAPTTDGKRAPTCTKCGFIGGRSSGCGTAHPTQAIDARDPIADDAEVEAHANEPAPREPVNKGGKMICRSCGFVGGNARGCGRAHPTLHETVTPPARTASTPARSAAEVEAARENRRERIERVSAKAPPSSGRPPQLGMRTTIPRAATPVTCETDDDQDDNGRWSTSRIADETRRAEASKRAGELPVPRATFDSRGFPRGGGGQG